MYAIVFVICLVFIAATILLGRAERKLLKYIPLFVALSATTGFYIKAYFFSNNDTFEALGYIIFMLFSATVSVVSLLTAAAIDIIKYVKKRK